MNRWRGRAGRIGAGIMLAGIAIALLGANPARAQVCNVKVVTDANPDYYDLPSLVHSVTAPWPTPEQKCWAMFYWNHIARRQTAPMVLHGLELTDPIRQFNDYGYTMCSTVAGVNCAIWQQMGFPVRFWDISLHTVSECRYGDRWHIYDNSMSAIYTLCDGVTVAGVEDVGKEGACAASGGVSEPGHIAKYHCLHATSPNGFLTGADCPRDLAQEYRCFHPAALKHRYYYNNWDWGHRYILNLRDGETYTRFYRSLGEEPRYCVPNHGKDPEAANVRYRIRGNGRWSFEPRLTPADFGRCVQAASDMVAVAPEGLQPARPGVAATATFKVQSANVTTAQTIKARVLRRTAQDTATIEVSTTNGLTWTKVWEADGVGQLEPQLDLVAPVNGAYETLIRVTLNAAAAPEHVRLERFAVDTLTMLNSKTQPALRQGKNTVYVGLGEQSDAVVFWPELQSGRYKPYAVDEANVTTLDEHQGYTAVMFAAKANAEAHVTYRLDTPADLTRVTYGGRFYNRASQAVIRLSHSFDGGQQWHDVYTLKSTEPPWDVIHYETVDDVPAGTRSVLVKYAWNAADAGPMACGLYAVRMEANHRPVAPGFRPLEVTFRWQEVQPDRTLVARSHTQRVDRVPLRYTINVGGADHPVVESLRVNVAGAVPDVAVGYSDGRDVGGERFRDRWVTYGRNLAVGKPYTVSVPPTGQWGSDDPAGKKLTDGIVGSLYAGGTAMQTACGWDTKSGQPEITVDLGRPQRIGAFRIHLTAGWPWWDALQGEVRDAAEVLVSRDGTAYESCGTFDFDLRRKNIPINHMLTDEETAQAWNFERVLQRPIEARWVRFKLQPQRSVGVTEVQALESITYEPFDLRIALPDE